MAATCAHSSQKLLAYVLILFLGRHSAREIHSMALDETHDKNVASFRSQSWKSIKPKLLEVNENNSDLCLDTLESMNYEYNKTMLTSFWVKQLPEIPAKTMRNYLN